MSVAEHYGKSAHALRADLRKANIDIKILERKLASAKACLQGNHMKPDTAKPCILCGN